MGDETGENLARLLALLGVATVDEAEQKIGEHEQKMEEQERTIARLDGSIFCSIDELYRGRWVVYSEDHFMSLHRNWDDNEKIFQDDDVVKVHDRTRREARNVENRVSTSATLMTVRNKKPVRLCSHEKTQNYAEKAHLCPKTGKLRKVDTWIYAAAAVLGMRSDTLKDRQALLKALRGSVEEGKTNVIPLTGLNRSPFNLMPFLLQEIWFDKHPGVIAIPCLEPSEARDWSGKSYNIIVLCNNVLGVSTADDIAASIALTRTPRENLHEATHNDIIKATSLLEQVLLAAAFCLMEKDGPDTEEGRVLWRKYKESLLAHQHTAHAVNGADETLRSVFVPTFQTVPSGKLVAKINLAEMTPPEGGNPAYPDPLLLAYKSSVNWTRRYGFQMMAEAEQDEDVVDPDGIIPRFISIDQGSKVSTDGGSIHTN